MPGRLLQGAAGYHTVLNVEPVRDHANAALELQAALGARLWSYSKNPMGFAAFYPETLGAVSCSLVYETFSASWSACGR